MCNRRAPSTAPVLSIVLALVFYFACESRAEAQAGAQPTAQPPSAQPNSGTSSQVKIFDDSVFNLQSTQSPAAPTRTTPKGNTVYLDEEPNYNQEQRKRWMKSCEGLQDNRKAYRDCFESEKRSDLGRKADSIPSPSPTGAVGSGARNGLGADGSSGVPVEKVADPYDSIQQSDDASDED